MEIRAYAAADREACLAVLDSLGVPGRDSFAAYLDSAPSYFVAGHEGRIVGCGGIAVENDAARLEWGMVHREFQRQGLGRFLLFYRTREISRQGPVERVTVRVPSAAAGFYSGQGFREISEENGWVVLSKRLAVCS